MTLVVGVNPCILGLNYHDPAVVVLDSGTLACAVEEQRCLGRRVHGIFPADAFTTALAIVRASKSDVSHVGVPFKPALLAHRESELVVSSGPAQPASLLATVDHEALCAFELRQRLGTYKAKFSFFEHHLCHAVSAFRSSSFSEAIVIVNDGVGEIAATSFWTADVGSVTKSSERSVTESLGYFYAAITAYLGFEPWRHEGKTMALAGYGCPDGYVDGMLSQLFIREGRVSLTTLSSCFRDGYWFDFSRAKQIVADALGRPPADDDQAYESAFYRSVAWWAQHVLEEVVVADVASLVRGTGTGTVCVAGGVHYNCKLNQRIRELPSVRQFFVQPVAGDAGVALGAALLASPGSERVSLPSLSLGIEADEKRITEAVLTRKSHVMVSSLDLSLVADALAAKKIAFWVRGRGEFGPRALGCRSILADPTDAALAGTINLEIKGREVWRPFGPMLLRRCAEDVLESGKTIIDGKFMVESWTMKSDWAKRLAGVVHPADRSCRPQLVDPSVDPVLYELLELYYSRNGVPGLLNTSLNPRGVPILEGAEAVADFYCSTPAAALLIVGDTLIAKVV